MLSAQIPLSLYIHIPWCVKKCPYCDFNSHALKTDLPEQDYVDAVVQDLSQDLIWVQDRPLSSIFFGGGTPSLFSPRSIEQILQAVDQKLGISDALEISLEANPGTVEQQRFSGFKAAGINRLSLGIQSFNNDKLHKLGRIHDGDAAKAAINAAQAAGFTNINLDLMYGLPQQTLAQALFDLKTALSFSPTHLSWYQLTLEPHTAFYHRPPRLPSDDMSWEMQIQGQAYLSSEGFNPYEISAYCKTLEERCLHNVNYWQFGDYLGIGAGAHAKLTQADQQCITRYWKTKHPKDYLNTSRDRSSLIAGRRQLSAEELPLEFMMNALRLYADIPFSLFLERTGLPIAALEPGLQQASSKGLLKVNASDIEVTELGRRYLNDLLLYW